MLRLGACMGCAVHIIEPCGFPFSVKALRRSAMDYIDMVTIHHHMDWDAFEKWCATNRRRIVLLTTACSQKHTEFTYSETDILLVGRESGGVTDQVVAAADGKVRVPMQKQLRSLNVAVSMAMVLGEALRQTGSFDTLE
ncbi:tRNA (cytidine(34)-2'-O)-methyltransferase [Kordiimonas sediminis]|uniref:tRNA (Cytidine(34)-2'-O)-methyltransferase n=2 Tax=Kordiimonas sediminis TaxID=1735581 RepID=A0A919ART2_9PROT|nr:tRNA (cytidine(34)-2'-O)-methyltransferase [Kordiimonas sediminis]